MEVCATKAWGRWRSGLLELRGYLTEGVLVLARNRNDCIFLSPDDAVPEYNLMPFVGILTYGEAARVTGPIEFPLARERVE